MEEKGNVGACKHLVEAGDDVNAEGQVDSNVTSIAPEACCTIAVEQTLMWMQYGYTVYMCYTYTRGSRVAEERQHGNCVAAVEGRLDVNATCKGGQTLESGQWQQCRSTGLNGETRHHKAALHDSKACVWMLLEAGVNVSAVDKRGEIPLHIAIERRHTTVAAGRLAGWQLLCSRLLHLAPLACKSTVVIQQRCRATLESRRSCT